MIRAKNGSRGMRTMRRNLQKIFYRPPGKSAVLTPILDEWGNETGEYQGTVSFILPMWASVSPARGETEENVFGTFADYDKTVVLGNVAVDETCVFWIDEPDTKKPYDYIVKKVAKSKNQVVVAVKKVEISHVPSGN